MDPQRSSGRRSRRSATGAIRAVQQRRHAQAILGAALQTASSRVLSLHVTHPPHSAAGAHTHCANTGKFAKEAC